jgi:hypothetical protein
MLTSKSISTGCAVWALAFSLLAPPIFAQEQFGNLYFTVGTVTFTQGQHWAYLLIDSSQRELLQGQYFAIYSKAGTPSAAGSYVRLAVLNLQTHPMALAVLLQRAKSVGDDPSVLDGKIADLFQNLMPSASLKPQDKLSIVVQGAIGNPELFDNLLVLSRIHPSIRMALGLAHAEMIPAGQTTFEVRLFDLAHNKDLAVIGRVSLTAGVPPPVPAAGAPVRVPEANPKGDLNVKLRWATPKELRRVSLLTYGYNIYRIESDFAQQNGYHVASPPTATLLNLAASNPAVKRVNRVPVLSTTLFTETDVANFSPAGDPSTFYFVDDNQRDQPDSTLPPNVFTNGARFYYLVTARDLLGRDGAVSPPSSQFIVCDRVPPPAVNGVQVENDYTFVPGPLAITNQRLKVTWRQYTGPKDRIAGYKVYRWISPGDVQKPGANQQAPISALITHVPGKETLSFVDNGAGAPQMPQAAGQTYWYTVRAVDSGACDDGNLSAHSAPAFGVLRDREGPPPPAPRLAVRCREPEGVFAVAFQVAGTSTNPDLAQYQLLCTREEPGGADVEWAEFYHSVGEIGSRTGTSNFVGRVYFPKQSEVGASIEVPFSIARTTALTAPLNFFCRIGTRQGELSRFVSYSSSDPPSSDTKLAVAFTAQVAASTNCESHTSFTNGVEVCAGVNPGAKEFRVYQRTDSGPLRLIGQGGISNQLDVCVTDYEWNATAATGCYFVQFLDEHGNASPIVLAGCIPIVGKGQLPKPLLTPPVSLTTPADPDVMRVQWFVPPFGIDRFEVHLALDNAQVPDSVSALLVKDPKQPNAVEEPVLIQGIAHKKIFKTFLTPQVSPTFGDGAQFQVDVDVQKNAKYTVMVRAIDKAGVKSEYSVGQEFEWSAPQPPVPQVPWPARPLPPVTNFHPAILAQIMPPDVFRGVGVLIGHIAADLNLELGLRELPTYTDPVEYLYKGQVDARLFPVALYRLQVTNLFFPQVSGDVVQVSPLMERIAYEQLPDANQDGKVSIQLHDPFIGIHVQSGAVVNDTPYDIRALYLLDTQPVVRGATYRYLLVRFDPQTKEMVQVIPTNEVYVP